MNTVYITQGQQAVGRDPEMVVTTILGSCISIFFASASSVMAPLARSRRFSIDLSPAVSLPPKLSL